MVKLKFEHVLDVIAKFGSEMVKPELIFTHGIVFAYVKMSDSSRK